MSYTGAAVDGATVKYRVVREVRMPWWWGWWRGGWPPEREPGNRPRHRQDRRPTARSRSSSPPSRTRKSPEKDEPTFVFPVNADVTDSAGETRSADRAIRVGYTALEAMLSAEDWQTDGKPVELKLETKTLDGEPQVAEGTVKIYRLQAAGRKCSAAAAGIGPWRYGGEFSGGGRRGRAGQGFVEPEQLAVGQGGGGAGLHHGHEWRGEAVVQAGGGRLSGGAGDARPVWQEGHRASCRLQVLQPEATKLAIKIPHLLAAPDWEVQPGQEFMALWGTGYETGRAFIEIEQRAPDASSAIGPSRAARSSRSSWP